jgi:hypothetical protein
LDSKSFDSRDRCADYSDIDLNAGPNRNIDATDYKRGRDILLAPKLCNVSRRLTQKKEDTIEE